MSATPMNDLIETFLCSAMILPCIILSQTLPIILLERCSPSLPTWLLWLVLTLVEMAGWAGPVIAIFASPNIESSWVIGTVCFILAALSAGAVRRMTRIPFGFRVSVWERSVESTVPYMSVTYVRICSLLFTVLGIFCVDFPNFGERFMKTETFGLTLMDIGIGCSLFSSGLSEGLRVKKRSLWKRMFWGSVPVAVVGLFRTAILTSIGYRVEVTEYGRHWNAFLTFAMMPIFMVILERLIPKRLLSVDGGCLVAVLLFVTVYQYALTQSSEYLMDNDLRRNLLEANKEGIASLAGFFAIFLGGRLYGSRVMKSTWSPFVLVPAFAGLTLLGVALDWGWIGGSYIAQPVSRRLCNAPYALFAVGMNACLTQLISVSMNAFVPHAKSIMTQGHAPSHHHDPHKHSPHATRVVLGTYTSQVNKHQFLYFVVANIVTGLTNIAMDTHALSDFASYFVQAAYVVVLAVFVLIVPDIPM